MEASVLIFFLITAQPTSTSVLQIQVDSVGFFCHVISSFDVSHLSY